MLPRRRADGSWLSVPKADNQVKLIVTTIATITFRELEAAQPRPKPFMLIVTTTVSVIVVKAAGKKSLNPTP